MDLKEAIADIQNRHFRTEDDTGAHDSAMIIMNAFRKHAGLNPLTKRDLPTWDDGRNSYVDKDGNVV